jgi:hypothetical protein
MAEVLPVAFPIPGESAIASYNYTDIAEGTGVVSFYGAQTYDTTATTKYILTTESITSNNPEILNPSGVYSFNVTAFNMPKTIKGTAYLSFGRYMNAIGGTIYTVDAKLQKDSGGTVTDCSNTFRSDSLNANGIWKMSLMAIPLTQTHFKKGDILRLYLTINGPGNGEWAFGCDPTGRSGTYITSALTAPSMTTKMTLNVPFKLDL